MNPNARGWTLNEQLIACLLGGVAGLLCEIRFEHREALGETWHAWVPLVYAGVAVTIGGISLARFRNGGRQVLAVLFGLGFGVSALGVWFHSEGHPLQALGQVATAWLIPLGHDGGMKIGSKPPVLAPAAFAGLGLLGLLACRRPHI